MSFVKCLALGHNCERVVMRYLVDYPGLISLEFSQGKFKDWDIKMKYKKWKEIKEVTYEVKSDRKSEQTGNCCIECMYKGEPSGIYASKADYIVYYTDHQWWIQERSVLLDRLEMAEKITKNGGDGHFSKLYLITVDKLPELFEHLNITELPYE